MEKMNKKIGLVIGGVALVLGILAVPVFAGTDAKTELQAIAPPMNITSQNIKTVADTPATPANPNNQTGCGSISAEAMQNMHNSAVMQEAMNSGDINKMKDAINSPEIKAQLGDDVVNSMNEMMSGENINSMQGSQGMMGSGTRNMMNWQ